MAHLLVLKGPNQRQSIPLDKERIVLGRNATCDIVFPANDFAVSREHACIVRTQSRFFLEDMGSRNGTFLNNQQLAQKQVLKENDKIRICDFIYSFHETAASLAAAMLPEAGEPTVEDEGPTSIEASITNTGQSVLEAQPSEKLRALIDISNNLSKTLELDPLLPKIVESLFQLFKQADRGFIILRELATEKEKVVDRLIPKVIRTRRGPDDGTSSYSRSIVRECAKTGQALLSDDASSDKRFSMSQSITDFRIRSVMCGPLTGQDNKVFGVIQVDTQDRGKKFTQDDLSLLMAVANQASNALENARLHEDSLARERLRRDLELAHQVQMSFLPQGLPKVNGYQFYSHYEPAQEVGGDYYGFIPLGSPSKRLAIMLGDVAGKGIAAALLMAKLSADTRFAFLSQDDPAAAMCVLNDLLYQNTAQMDRFVTLTGAILDLETHSVTLVNAGHPSPVIHRRATGEMIEATTRPVIGLPLGIMEGFSYECKRMELQPGDSVLLFSDGVTEAMDVDNNQLGLEAIEKALKDGSLPPQELGERIVSHLRRHAAGRSQHDDITLVCFGRDA